MAAFQAVEPDYQAQFGQRVCCLKNHPKRNKTSAGKYFSEEKGKRTITWKQFRGLAASNVDPCTDGKNETLH